MRLITGIGLLIALVIATSSPGCGSLKRHDPLTVEQVQKTLEFEDGDYTLTVAALEDGEFSDIERQSMEVRHASEMSRLRAWLEAEEAKKVGE